MFKVALLVLAGLALGGCTAPERLDQEALLSAADTQRQKLVERLSSANQPLTLPEALVFALENNLEFRLRAYDAALATGNRKLATLSMLPTLTARAGYRYRNNLQASVSESVETGRVSLEPSVSTDRESHNHELEIGWNVLDFGLAWFRAREFGEQALVAEEERRRVSHQLAVELINAWDKAAAYQSVAVQLDEARTLLDDAMTYSEQIMERRLRDQVEVIEYRKALLLILRRINRLTQQMNEARDELSRLLGLPAGVPLSIVDNGERYAVLDAGSLAATDTLQWTALLYRPEMRQALYTQRSIERDTLRRTLDALPSLLVSYGGNYDSNSYLVNNHWRETGVNLSMNLIKLASLPGQRRLGKINEASAAARVELQATAILSQVAIAEKSWRAASIDACVSEQLASLDTTKLAMLNARARAAALDQLTVIRSRVDNLLFVIEAALDRAEMRRASLMLASSVGVGAIPEAFSTEDPEGKANEIAQWLSHGMSAALYDAQGNAMQARPSSVPADETSGEAGAQSPQSATTNEMSSCMSMF